MMITLHACLVTSLVAGPCYAILPPAPPPLPEWATREWIHDAAGIVAGESVPGCDLCDLWIACAVVEDVTLRGYHPWHLRPGRWHGWREPRGRHYEAVRDALEGRCDVAPECAYLGSFSDYLGRWRSGLAHERQVLAVGNSAGVVICVPDNDD